MSIDNEHNRAMSNNYQKNTDSHTNQLKRSDNLIDNNRFILEAHQRIGFKRQLNLFQQSNKIPAAFVICSDV